MANSTFTGPVISKDGFNSKAPTTAKGKLRMVAADSAGDTTTTITNASQAAARTYTIPDAGASASFVMTQGAQTIAGATTFSSSIIQTGKQIIIPAWFGKAGATAGWVVTGADDGLARLPASQTNATLVIPISGLQVGWTVTAVAVNGQVESAGNNVTMTMSVRKATAAAADFTDAQIGTDNVGTLTSDTKITSAELGVTGLTEVMAADEYLYVLITATTAASTDIAVANLLVTVTTV